MAETRWYRNCQTTVILQCFCHNVSSKQDRLCIQNLQTFKCCIANNVNHFLKESESWRALVYIDTFFHFMLTYPKHWEIQLEGIYATFQSKIFRQFSLSFILLSDTPKRESPTATEYTDPWRCTTVPPRANQCTPHAETAASQATQPSCSTVVVRALYQKKPLKVLKWSTAIFIRHSVSINTVTEWQRLQIFR